MPLHLIRYSHGTNQVSKDNQLLNTARDCFYFVTKFFEPINLSRPRVAIGAPDSWDDVVTFSNKDHHYGFCIWLPCGRFVAAQTAGAVEIRDQLTFELLTTLKPRETIHPLTGPLAYSPDGSSIACGSDTSVVLWDIQTGGVANEIRGGLENISMAWSLDGMTIGFIDSKKGVHTYNLTSATTTSLGKISSTGDPYFWAHETSFRIITIVPSDGDCETTVEVFEAGYILARIHSFNFTWNTKPQSNLNISYSPSTSRFAISAYRAFHVFEDWDWILCHPESDSIYFHRFSPDGSLFAVVVGERIRVWKYASRLYEQWKDLRCPGHADSIPQFSPTQSSILGSFGSILQGWCLHDLFTTLEIFFFFFFFFLNSYFYPSWHPCGQAGWLPTTQVLKGSLLLESGENNKEKQKVRVAMKSGSN